MHYMSRDEADQFFALLDWLTNIAFERLRSAGTIKYLPKPESAHDALEELLDTVWKAEAEWRDEDMWQLRLMHTPLEPRISQCEESN